MLLFNLELPGGLQAGAEGTEGRGLDSASCF